MLVLCSETSVLRPWINFEAGAGWTRGIETVPLCHSGLRPVDLPLPLNLLQGIEASDVNKIEHIFKLIADKLGSETTKFDASSLASEVKQFEQLYSIEIRSIRQLAAINKSWPELIIKMKKANPHRMIVARSVPDWRVQQVRSALTDLQSNNLLSFAYSTSGFTMSVYDGPDDRYAGIVGSNPSPGVTGDLNIRTTPDLASVLQKRF
jgi:hypothetical protein